MWDWVRYYPGSSKSWKFHVKSGDYQFFEGLSEKKHRVFKLLVFEVKLLEIDCRFWKWFAHLKPLEIAIIRYLTEGTLAS